MSRWHCRRNSALRVTTKTIEHSTIGLFGVVQLRRLDDLRDRGQSRVRHDAPKRGFADGALADELVAVAPRAERRLGVVEVHRTKPLESDDIAEARHHVVVLP